MPSTQKYPKKDNKISHYHLVELLVEQPISLIYLANDADSGDTIFLITLTPEAAKSSDLVDRFQRRAETVAQLKQEAILPLLDYGLDGKRPFAVLPHFPGQFLAEHLAAPPAPTPNDQTQIVESLNLVKRIAEALALAHPAGLIHHDLRPKNIYLDAKGNPYLLDLAVPAAPPIIAQIEAAQPTQLDYQAPEQLAGKALSGRSNIFSLGILLYRLLAGQQPSLPVSEWDIFEHKGMAREIPLQQVRPNLTQATYRVVQDSIWQKEWSRFETIDAQILALERAIQQESAPPPPPPPAWRKALTQLRQPKTLKVVIPAILLLFLLLLALLFMRGRGNRQEAEAPMLDTAVLFITPDSAVPTESQGQVPQVTTTSSINEADIGEESVKNEALPATTEVKISTRSANPVETAVATTSPTPTVTPSSTTQPTNSPTSTEAAQTSCIAAPPFGWVRYAIQSNDSLSSLGQATNSTVSQLQQVNCLDTILLSIGQEIWLPFAPNPTVTATNAAPTAVPPDTTPTTSAPPGSNPTSTPVMPTLTPPSVP